MARSRSLRGDGPLAALHPMRRPPTATDHMLADFRNLALAGLRHYFGQTRDPEDARAMTKPGPWTKTVRETRGSQVAEAALVMPLAFMLLLGIYWFGRAFNTYATINSAAREGARIAVAQTCATCGNGPPLVTTVASTVTQTMQASSVNPSQIIAYPSTPTPANCPAPLPAATCTVTAQNVTVCTNVALTAQVCGVTVSFQYPYQFWLPFTSLNNQQIILTADVQMQGEY